MYLVLEMLDYLLIDAKFKFNAEHKTCFFLIDFMIVGSETDDQNEISSSSIVFVKLIRDLTTALSVLSSISISSEFASFYPSSLELQVCPVIWSSRAY